MKQLQTLLTCDAHAAWQDQPDVTDRVETVRVSAGQTLDLCPEHREGLQRVWALVSEWGRAPERGAPALNGRKVAARSVSAPEAPALTPSAPNRRGGARARQRRSKSVVSVNVLACPLCGAQRHTTDAMALHLRGEHHLTPAVVYGGTCPLCAKAGSEQGLGTHANKAHGIHGVAALFAAAQHDGDPHGVIASRAHTLAATLTQPAPTP